MALSCDKTFPNCSALNVGHKVIYRFSQRRIHLTSVIFFKMLNFLLASTELTAIMLTKFLSLCNTVLDFYLFSIFVLTES